MTISNYMNNTNSIMEKNTDKVQKGNSQTNEKHTVGPVSYTHLDVYKRQGISNAANRASATYTNNGTYAKTDSLLTSSKIDEEV